MNAQSVNADLIMHESGIEKGPVYLTLQSGIVSNRTVAFFFAVSFGRTQDLVLSSAALVL